MKNDLNEHQRYYEQAKYYDIAFDFRNIQEECYFFQKMYQNEFGKKMKSFLELAAGPAQHALWMAKNNYQASALDRSESMVKYGLSQAKKQEIDITYYQDDMIQFSLSSKFDLMVLLMDSASYILTNEQMIEHLKNVAKHLNSEGLYILEMGHPREIFKTASQTNTDWKMEREGVIVHTQWGTEHDEFDPITQITQVTAKMTVTLPDQQVETYEYQAPQRSFTAPGFDALVKASGVFRMVKQFGSLDESIAFSNDPKSWRMVSVLKPV